MADESDNEKPIGTAQDAADAARKAEREKADTAEAACGGPTTHARTCPYCGQPWPGAI